LGPDPGGTLAGSGIGSPCELGDTARRRSHKRAPDNTEKSISAGVWPATGRKIQHLENPAQKHLELFGTVQRDGSYLRAEKITH
jgi:hypothetical protein